MGLLCSSLHVCDVQNFGMRVSIRLIEARKIKEVPSRLVSFTRFLAVSDAIASIRTINEDFQHRRRPNKWKFLIY
jgi:hypothetical protein